MGQAAGLPAAEKSVGAKDKDAETMAGVLFWDNWYDRDGIIHIDRVVHTPQQAEKAESWMKTTEADPLCFRPGAKTPWRWKETKVEEGFMQVGALQAKLAGDAGLKYNRLDPLSFTSFRPDSKAQLQFKGVCLNPAYGDASGKKTINVKLDQKTFATWPSMTSRFSAVTNPNEIKDLRQPWPLLQIHIARGGDVAYAKKKNPLDGVGIAPDAYYDEEGRLCLRGVWLGTDQKKHLEPLLGILPRFKLMRNNKDFQLKLVELRSDLVLKELRVWLADPLKSAPEDARAERLFFDIRGRLTLQSHHVLEKDKDAIREQLRQIIEVNPKMNGKDNSRRPGYLHRDHVGQGKARRAEDIHFVSMKAAPPPPKRAKIDSTPWSSRTQELREMVQWPIEGSDKFIPRSLNWDGIGSNGVLHPRR